MTDTTQTGTSISRIVEGVELPTTGTYVLDPTHTRIGFVARHLMVTKVRGHFPLFEGSITIADDPQGSTADVTIQTASVDTGTADRDTHLRSADFFDAEKFPEMTFRNARVVSQKGTDFTVVGELTIKDVTREVQLAVELDGIVKDPWGDTRLAVTAQHRHRPRALGPDLERRARDRRRRGLQEHPHRDRVRGRAAEVRPPGPPDRCGAIARRARATPRADARGARSCRDRDGRGTSPMIAIRQPVASDRPTPTPAPATSYPSLRSCPAHGAVRARDHRRRTPGVHRLAPVGELPAVPVVGRGQAASGATRASGGTTTRARSWVPGWCCCVRCRR